jgi:DNA-binding NtrC family response regulator
MPNILIVDDDSDLRALMELFLKRAGHEVVSCGDPESAIVAVADMPQVDCAVLDVWLGLKSGLDLYDQILEREPDLPVIFVSGGGGRIPMETTTALADLKGAKTFLYKPFRGDALVEAVTKAIEN